MNFLKRGTASMNLGDCHTTSSDHNSKLHLSACVDSFKKHWQQIQEILKKYKVDTKTEVIYDDMLTVVNHLNQINALLNLELKSDFVIGSCIEYLLNEDLLELLCLWTVNVCECNNSLRVEQLQIYEVLCSVRGELLTQEKFLNPLLRLLSSFNSGCVSVSIEKRLLVLVNQLCFSGSEYPEVLPKFFPASCIRNGISDSALDSRFDIFSLLVQFVHRDGMIGEQARDSLLICMSLSQSSSAIAHYITSQSNICPVLAAGLSGLYSLLPRKLHIDSPDWFRFAADDVYELKELTNFMNSLEFCNAISQICHPGIRAQLLHYIYQAFLVPVMGPALLQECVVSEGDCRTPLHLSIEEEVIAATAYFELILRSVTHPGLLHAFIKFILKEDFEGQRVIERLIDRINNSPNRLCIMILSLLETILDLNNEEVMLELVLKHLIPCTHVMSSQRSRIHYLDPFCKSAEKFMLLTVNLAKYSDCMENEVYNNYYAYVRNARNKIQFCIKATSTWTYPYDGENPSYNTFQGKQEDAKQTADNGDLEHVSLPSADDGSSGYESFKAYKELDKFTNDDGVLDDTRSNPPSPCGSESPLERKIESNQKSKLSNSSCATRKSTYAGAFATTPSIGPFLNAVFQKLENMLNFDFYIALRLTGIVSRLAMYPQPLIHSFLLDHSLVFQPSIKSLIQILGSLKQKIESRIQEEKNMSKIVKECSAFLIQRLESLNTQKKPSEYPSSLPADIYSSKENSNRGEHKRKSLSVAIGSMFRKNNNCEQVEFITKGSVRSSKSNNTNDIKNVTLCVIIFNEWLKELAAIAQEHVILRLP